MKKYNYIVLVLIVTIGSTIVGCENKKEVINNVQENIVQENEKIQVDKEVSVEIKGDSKNKKFILKGKISGEEISFKADRARIGSYTEGKEFPYTRLYTEDAEFINEKYNEEYFKTKALIVIGLRENSGSIRHTVTKVTRDKEVINIEIKRDIPEIGTADMAEWEIYIEVEKKDIGDATEINLVI